MGDINIGSRGQLLVWLGDHHKYHDIKDQKQLDAHYQTDTYIDLNAQRVYLAYLIKVVPELKVNGVLKLTGSEMNLGSELVFKTNIIHPGRSSQINYVYKIPAGSYVSVNTIAGSVSRQKTVGITSAVFTD